jgi:hypothetical protein
MAQRGAASEFLAFVLAYRSFFAMCAEGRAARDAHVREDVDGLVSQRLQSAYSYAASGGAPEAWPRTWSHLAHALRARAAADPDSPAAECTGQILRYLERLHPQTQALLTSELALRHGERLLLGTTSRMVTAAMGFWGPRERRRSDRAPKLLLDVRDDVPKRRAAGYGIELSYDLKHSELWVIWHRWSSFGTAGPWRCAGDYARLQAGVFHEIVAHRTREIETVGEQDGWMAYLALRREADRLEAMGLGDCGVASLLGPRDEVRALEELADQSDEYMAGWDAAHRWYMALKEAARVGDPDRVCAFDGAAPSSPYVLLHLLTKVGLGGGVCRSRGVPCSEQGSGLMCALLGSVLREMHESAVEPGLFERLREDADRVGLDSVALGIA